jgi:hypothetical protein
MDNPWAFGWTQLLGVSGLLLTAAIGGFGLRTLNKWRREKIEEKKVDLARMKRLQFHREFFERAYAMQPRCTALFGVEAENAFNKLHEARRAIESACEMLTHHIKRPQDDEALWFQLRADILGGGGFAAKAKEPKRVDKMLEEFRAEVERLCRPSLEGQRSWVDHWPRWLRLRRKSPAAAP